MKKQPYAIYIGTQENTSGKPPIPLYNVYGGKFDKSTVTEKTLIKEGIRIDSDTYSKSMLNQATINTLHAIFDGMTANELLDTQKILTDEKLKLADNPGKYTYEWEVKLIGKKH